MIYCAFEQEACHSAYYQNNIFSLLFLYEFTATFTLPI